MTEPPRARRGRTGLGALLLVAVAVAVALGAGGTTPPRPVPAGTVAVEAHGVGPDGGSELAAPRRLILDERFGGDRLDRTRWGRCHWWGDGGCTIATNRELQWYLPGNVTVGDGVLRLAAQRRWTRAPDGRRFPYRSGMISSGPPAWREPARFSFTYGYVEARLRVPRGRGLWSALWLLSADSRPRPEVDIVEILGHRPNVAHLHLHAPRTADRPAASRGRAVTVPGLGRGWHRFGLSWQPGSLTWYIDGRPRWRVVGERVPDEPLYLVLSLAVGGNWPGSPDSGTRFPAVLAADWIRVWTAPPP